MDLFHLASRSTPSYNFRGAQNDCSVMLYLTIEHDCENFGVGAISRLTAPWLLDLLAKLSASLRNKGCKRLGSLPKQSVKRWLSLLIF